MNKNKIKKMLKFFNKTINEMIEDTSNDNLTEYEFFEKGIVILKNNFSKKNIVVAETDISKIAFMLSEDENDLIFLNGEDFINDEN